MPRTTPPTEDDNAILTRATVIAGISSGPSNEAWMRFYQVYHGVILATACRWGLSASSAQDVLQDVMFTVSQAAHTFTYDAKKRVFHARGFTEGQSENARGGFRQWLFTVVNRTIWKYRYGPRQTREITFSNVENSGDRDRLRDFRENENVASAAPDKALQEKAEQEYRVALLEEAIQILPACTKRSHPRKLAIFLVLKLPHVFAAIKGSDSTVLPSEHLEEFGKLASLTKLLGRELTKEDVMRHYGISSNHVDQEVKAIKEKLTEILSDLQAGHDPRPA